MCQRLEEHAVLRVSLWMVRAAGLALTLSGLMTMLNRLLCSSTQAAFCSSVSTPSPQPLASAFPAVQCTRVEIHMEAVARRANAHRALRQIR